MKNANNIQYKYVQIKTEQFATLIDDVSQVSDIEIQTGLEIKANKENKQIGVYLSFEYLLNENPILIIKTSNHFIIEESSWEDLCSDKGDKLLLPEDFSLHLIKLSVGTTRGILHEKTVNTSFNRLILPSITIDAEQVGVIELILKENM